MTQQTTTQVPMDACTNLLTDAPQGPLGIARPLFLIGAARSGTTALSHILDAHPRIIMTNETAVHIQLELNIRNSRTGVRAGIPYGKAYHKLWADHLQRESRGLIERYYAQIASDQQKSTDPDVPDSLAYYGEKHPHLCNCLDFIDQTFPEARYIYIVRDPRDSAISIANMVGRSFEEALEIWLAFDEQYAPFVDRLGEDRVYHMRYEALVTDYEGQVDQLMQWLGLEMHEHVRVYLSKYAHVDSHTISGRGQQIPADASEPNADAVPFARRSAGRWKRTLTSEQAAFADRVAGEALVRYGYDQAGNWSPDQSSLSPIIEPHHQKPPAPLSTDPITFTCNVCSATVATTYASLGREIPACETCRSTARMRAMVHLLSLQLFGESYAIENMPHRQDLRVLGLCDWAGYASRLSSRLDYRNTRLWAMNTPTPSLTTPDAIPFFNPHTPDAAIATPGSLAAIIASDVLHRVPQPIVGALTNLRKLLAPSGSLIASVPYRVRGDTLEYYPELHSYRIEQTDGNQRLINHTADGHEQIFDHITRPGSDPSNLEMRLFSRDGLTQALLLAGFESPVFLAKPELTFGIQFEQPWSLPFIARVAPEP